MADPRTNLVKGIDRPSLRSSDLVMAWAIDVDTGEPRYILQLDGAHRGAKCRCKCPSCDLPLTAVNVAKTEFRNRPHFRHPEGAGREACLILAARRALEAMLGQQGEIVLPRRRRSSKVEGLSGEFHDAWVEALPERVRISDCDFRDEATAILTLDDGRQLLVQLMGRGEVGLLDGREALLARIELEADDPALATMSPDEIFQRLELAWSNACWTQHWADADLDHQAAWKARQAAAEGLDWLEEGDEAFHDLTPAERRETLLHREVKGILEREKRIHLPALEVVARHRRSNGAVFTKTWSEPATYLSLKSVELEVRLGCSVPDVVVEWVDDDGWTHSMLIEVTVTNPIGPERVERLASFGFPVLEIDIGRMGGVVTRDEFTRLVVDEVAGKRWLYHPDLASEEARLLAILQQEADQAETTERKRQEFWLAPSTGEMHQSPPAEAAVEKRRLALLTVSAKEWGEWYLKAFRQRWEGEKARGKGTPGEKALPATNRALQEAVEGLVAHGYSVASELDHLPLRTIVARILSIHDGTGVEYQYDTAWQVINSITGDITATAKEWHTLYLLAIRVYQPQLTYRQQVRVDRWREDVIASIGNGEGTYRRQQLYDELLGLLFPEMRDGLSKPFGTRSQLGEAEQNHFSTPIVRPLERDIWLRGLAFESWAQRNPESAEFWRDVLETQAQAKPGDRPIPAYGEWKRKKAGPKTEG